MKVDFHTVDGRGSGRDYTEVSCRLEYKGQQFINTVKVTGAEPDLDAVHNEALQGALSKIGIGPRLYTEAVAVVKEVVKTANKGAAHSPDPSKPKPIEIVAIDQAVALAMNGLLQKLEPTL